MASLADLSLAHRLYMKAYRYRSVDWGDGARLRKPLSQSKLAIISTAGLYLPGQNAFDHKIRGGDFSFRELPVNVRVSDLKVAHRSSTFDHAGVLQDRNLVFPLDRCRELVAKGELGALNERHFSFMGSITAPEKLVAETAPEVAALLRQDEVDAAFLLPV